MTNEETTCPNCNGYGFVARSEDDGRAYPCPVCAPARRAAQAQAEVAELAHLWPLPPRLAAFEWAWLGQRPDVDHTAARICRRWIGRWLDGETTGGLYLYGTMGRGKTGMAVCMLKTALAAGRPAVYAAEARLLEAMRERAQDGEEGRVARQRVRAARQAPLLVLDDLGVQHPTSYVLEQMVLLLDGRRDDNLATIITSNLSLEDLAALYKQAEGTAHDHLNTGRLINRLGEYCQLLHVEGKNQRPSWRRGSDFSAQASTTTWADED